MQLGHILFMFKLQHKLTEYKYQSTPMIVQYTNVNGYQNFHIHFGQVGAKQFWIGLVIKPSLQVSMHQIHSTTNVSLRAFH